MIFNDLFDLLHLNIWNRLFIWCLGFLHLLKLIKVWFWIQIKLVKVIFRKQIKLKISLRLLRLKFLLHFLLAIPMWVGQGSQVKILNLLDCHFRIWIGQWNWGCLEDCSQGFVWGFQYCSSCSERFNKLQPNLEYFEGAWLSELSSCSQLVGWLDLHLLIARIVFSWTVMRTCCRLAGENYRVIVLLDTKFPSHLLTNLFWFHLVVLLYPYRAHCLHLVWMKNCFNLNRPSCH